MKEITQKVKKTAEDLLSQMGLEGTVDVTENEFLLVNIQTEQAPILIGRHGETLSAFQVLLSQMTYSVEGEQKRIIVDCGGWRGKQEESLKNMALDAAQRVVETGSPQPLFNLRPDERRIVHMVLSDHPEVVTESEGEGRDRHLVIKPRS